MRLSDIPTKLAKVWAASAGAGTLHAIPTDSQIGVVDGAASLTDGFVPLNATPRASGGVPPDIKDFNGILRMLSAWTLWYQSGGAIRYDPRYVAATGGYPLGASVASAVTIGKVFISTVDNNVTDPDSGGSAGWISPGVSQSSQGGVDDGTGTGFFSPAQAHATPRSLTYPNGYVVRPDGLIEQWGIDTTGSEYSGGLWRRVAFPIPFPNTMLNIVATPQVEHHGSTNGDAISCRAYDASSFELSSDDQPTPANWRAIGF